MRKQGRRDLFVRQAQGVLETAAGATSWDMVWNRMSQGHYSVDIGLFKLYRAGRG